MFIWFTPDRYLFDKPGRFQFQVICGAARNGSNWF